MSEKVKILLFWFFLEKFIFKIIEKLPKIVTFFILAAFSEKLKKLYFFKINFFKASNGTLIPK